MDERKLGVMVLVCSFISVFSILKTPDYCVTFSFDEWLFLMRKDKTS